MVLFNFLRRAAPIVSTPPLRQTVLPILSQVTASPFLNVHNQQIRSIRMTKRKRHILAKRKKWAALALKGIYPPRPAGYLDKHEPVVNAKTREERDAEAREADAKAAKELRVRMDAVAAQGPRLRFQMDGLVMSDRVRKLFDLSNGNQSEVVQAQKLGGMALFQMREGDTGSSAVQVIALTTRIQQLQQHMKTHKKDKSSKRGLDALYVRRRKLLDYMERKEFESYRRVVRTLGLFR